MKIRQMTKTPDTTWGFAFTGEPGSGKTTAMCGFFPPNRSDDYHQIKGDYYRVIIPMEADRVTKLHATLDREDYVNMTGFNFDLFEFDETQLLRSYLDLIKLAKGELIGWDKPDMIGIDNATLFQSMVIDQIFKGNFQKEWEVIEFLKLDQQLYNFYHQRNGANKNVDSQQLGTVRKAIITNLMRTIRGNGIDLIITALPKNQWVDFGKTNMKIAGRKIDLNDGWLPMLDSVIWTSKYVTTDDSNAGWLSEMVGRKLSKGEVAILETPVMELERFHPKSFPGFPKDSFIFTNWHEFWQMVEMNKRSPEDSKVRTYMPETIITPEELFKVACEKMYNTVVQGDNKIGRFFRAMTLEAYQGLAIGWALEDGQPVDMFEDIGLWLSQRTAAHGKANS